MLTANVGLAQARPNYPARVCAGGVKRFCSVRASVRLSARDKTALEGYLKG